MLDWLKKNFTSWANVVSDQIRQFVYNQVYAVMSFLGTIVNHVSDAWHQMYTWANGLFSGISAFATSVYAYFYRIIRVTLPGIIRWADKAVKALTAWVWGHIVTLTNAIWALRGYLLNLIDGVLAWVKHSIYDPLMSEVTSLWSSLKKWGYTAWWYITHPQDLADLLLTYILISVQKSVWLVARTMGEFFFRLFMQNVPRSVDLIEKIISDVL